MMVFDAHSRAFAFFKGHLHARHLRQHEGRRSETVFIGKDSYQYNRSLPADVLGIT